MMVGCAGRWLRVWLMAVMLLVCARVWAQASAIPSAQLPGTESAEAGARKGAELLEKMVAALGGPAWLNRQDMVRTGRIATFYKGQPHPGVPGFIEYYRFQPFAQRVVLVTHFGDIIPHDHHDIAQLYTAEGGYEITYKGKTPLPVKEVEDFQRRRAHSLETIVQVWLKAPGTIVSYEGTDMVERRLAERISVLTAKNEGAVLALDETTHLPLSISFEWHDPVYKDVNTDVQEFEDYHLVQGIQTPYAITFLHNGDMTGQRFVSKVQYNTQLPGDMFDPDVPADRKPR
jgi:hypothetical protein